MSLWKKSPSIQPSPASSLITIEPAEEEEETLIDDSTFPLPSSPIASSSSGADNKETMDLLSPSEVFSRASYFRGRCPTASAWPPFPLQAGKQVEISDKDFVCITPPPVVVSSQEKEKEEEEEMEIVFTVTENEKVETKKETVTLQDNEVSEVPAAASGITNQPPPEEQQGMEQNEEDEEDPDIQFLIQHSSLFRHHRDVHPPKFVALAAPPLLSAVEGNMEKDGGNAKPFVDSKVQEEGTEENDDGFSVVHRHRGGGGRRVSSSTKDVTSERRQRPPRTQLCRFGKECTRRDCSSAHTLQEWTVYPCRYGLTCPNKTICYCRHKNEPTVEMVLKRLILHHRTYQKFASQFTKYYLSKQS